MTTEERQNINRDQINKFFSSYYSEWRYIQVLSIKKRLENKYDFYREIVEEIKSTDESAGEHTIAQEIENGLLFEAVQHSMQYIEDLFALISASQNQNHFIRSIIKYNAGKVDSFIKGFSMKDENICKMFHFPYFSKTEATTETDTLKTIYDSIDRLRQILIELIEFYKKHKFFYDQYKHGLSIALRPYGVYSSEQVEKDKKKDFQRPSIVALDSLNFRNASQNQYGNSGYLMMPAFTEGIRSHLNELQKENNLLRFVMSSPDTNIDAIKDIAYKTKRCLHIQINNLLETVKVSDILSLRLPAEEFDKVYNFDIERETMEANRNNKS